MVFTALQPHTSHLYACSGEKESARSGGMSVCLLKAVSSTSVSDDLLSCDSDMVPFPTLIISNTFVSLFLISHLVGDGAPCQVPDITPFLETATKCSFLDYCCSFKGNGLDLCCPWFSWDLH